MRSRMKCVLSTRSATSSASTARIFSASTSSASSLSVIVFIWVYIDSSGPAEISEVSWVNWNPSTWAGVPIRFSTRSMSLTIVLGSHIVEGTRVDLDRVMVADIDVQGFLVDLGRIDPARQHERGIHRPAPVLGQERAGEVDQAVEEEHDAVLIAIALAGEDPVCHQRMIGINGQAVDPFLRGRDGIDGTRSGPRSRRSLRRPAPHPRP